MVVDPREKRVRRLLAAAWPPPSGCEDRALAALADIHPRRHPNLLTFIIVAALLLLLAAGVFAAVRYFYVEGTLILRNFHLDAPLGETRGEARLLTGDLTWEIGDLFAYPDGDPGWVGLSRDGEKMCFHRSIDWPPVEADVFRSNTDRTDEVNLTAALGGINCYPSWSPDGSMIAFQHSDPVEGQMPCQAGFHGWVMSADGFDARPILPASRGENWCEGWLPDGSGLCLMEGSLAAPATDAPERLNRGYITADIWGRNIRTLPVIEHSPVWSPDGTMIASIRQKPDHVQGEPGSWSQLLLTNADGSNPRVLVEQFIADADVDGHGPAQELADDYPEIDWHNNFVERFGPDGQVWSPSSDQIAFLAAMPFDPDGLDFRLQVEVWVYDLTTDELIRITDDDVWQHQLIWRE